MFSVSGIVSGLDTDSIISQLVQLERVPIVRMRRQEDALRKVDDAWSQVTTKLSSLRGAIDKLSKLGDLTGLWKATSSETGVATASVTGTPSSGSLTFAVNQLAKAHQLASGSMFSSGDDLVGGTGFSVTIAGTTQTVAVDATTTLSQLASDVDALSGVSAQVVKVADGQHRLVLTAEQTGVASAVTVGGDVTSLGTFTDLQAATDAQIAIGGTSPLTITRSSNTVTDLIDGVTLTLKTTGSTTVTTSRDVDGAASRVKGLVDEVNATLAKLRELTAYDVDARKGGPLLGDPTVRRLVGDLRRVVSDTVDNLAGPHTYAGSVGIRLNNDGSFKLDEAKLKDALAADFDGVARLFARSGSAADTRLIYSTSTDTTKIGDYDITITQVARVAALTGTAYTPPPTNPEVFTITADDGTVVSVEIAVGDSAATAVTKINNALSAKGVRTIKANSTNDGTDDHLVLEETRHGSAYSFTVGTNNVGLTAGTYTGQDVAGTIDGLAAKGRGQVLTSVDGESKDLVVIVSAGQPDLDAAGGTLNLGLVEVAAGVAGRLSQLLKTYEGVGGQVDKARKAIDRHIEDVQGRIEAFERRVEQREITLRRQFTAMETTLSGLTAQGNWLETQFAAFSQQPR